MSAFNTYEGSCHCGAVKFEVAMPDPTKAYACNCSICTRAGWLLAFAKDDTFKLLHGEDAVTDYQFGKKKTHHVFCKTCGVRAYSHGTDKDGRPTMAVNLRCIAASMPWRSRSRRSTAPASRAAFGTAAWSCGLRVTTVDGKSL